MKKLLVLFVALFALVLSANAQYIPAYPASQPGENPVAFDEMQWNYNYIQLLQKQNTLLKRRAIALSVAVGGYALYSVGAALPADENGNISTPGVIMGVGGLLTTLVGGTWLLCNEFNMIGAQKAINEHMLLKVNPSGMQLAF